MKELMKDKENLKGQPDSLRGHVFPYTKHQGTVGGLGRETALIGKIQNFKICKGLFLE